MRIVAEFDPSQVSQDTFNAGFPNGVGKIVVYNESSLNLALSWGSFQTYCPAWTVMLYCISTNNININWEVHSQLASNSPPISQVIVEAYNDSEVIVGTYPAALNRQFNQGNVGSVSGATIQVLNDGNVPGTQILETTVAGQVSSNQTATNDGFWKLAVLLSGVPVVFFQSLDGSVGPILQLGQTGYVTEVLGPLQVDQTFSVNGIAAITGDVSLAANIFLGSPSTQTLSNNNTIAIPGAYVHVSCASNITGIVMTPGSTAGQLIHLYNQGTGSLTFAASGSHVRQGANIAVGNGKLLTMLWDGGAWATDGPVL